MLHYFEEQTFNQITMIFIQTNACEFFFFFLHEIIVWKMHIIKFKRQCVSPSGAEHGIFQENKLNTMVADALTLAPPGLGATNAILG